MVSSSRAKRRLRVSEDTKPKLTDKGKSMVESIRTELTDKSMTEISELDYDDFAEDFGIEYVGSGAMRVVFTTDDNSIVTDGRKSVIKVTKGLIAGNMREIANWHLIDKLDPDFAEERLATIYDYDMENAGWLLMEMVKDYPGHSRVRKEKSVFESRGWMVTDYGTGNTGLINDKVVLIDYGLPIEAVEENEKLEDTIYDDIPISETKFRRKGTTMEQEIQRLFERIRENDVTRQNITREFKRQE